ncbi:MAG: hypothetical protein AAF329_12320 [Cyanobacteria bacterium P01_A01_bin.17]
MVDVNEQKILQLAKQGNLQAVAVVLNRHLIAEGVHIKVKANNRSLQILLKAPEGTNQSAVLQILQQQMVNLQTHTFDIVKIYTPLPGTQTANLVHSFELTAPQSNTASQSNTAPRPAPQNPPGSKTQANGERVSVADFLARVTNLNDLKALKSHPFFTGQCPQCGAAYEYDELPVYWDCRRCGWRDDLSEMMSQVTDLKPKAIVAEMKRLGNYLMEAGLLTESQINVALADQEITGMRLGEALVRRGWVKEETIEYLMKKVIIPERQHTTEADLEVSRNLVQALLKQQPDAVAASQVSADVPSGQSPLSNRPPSAVPNERATLVLPDLDISEHLEDHLS